MNNELYYFSGTGNTLYVAKSIAKKTKGTLVPIASLQNNQKVKPKASKMGIIFPVYYMGVPIIVKKFIQKLENLENKYIYAIATYGGGVGNSLKIVEKLISERRGTLDASFGIHMPQNAFSKFYESPIKVLKKSKKKIEKISKSINRGKKGMLLSDLLFYILLSPISKALKPLYRKSLAELSNSSLKLPTEEFIYRGDKTFSVNEDCSGCGICAKVCPVENIEIENTKPVWQNHCENCLACYNFCPNNAINSEIAEEGFYYKHPSVTVSDMISQKKGK